MSDRRRGSPAGRFVGPAGLQRLGGGDAMCPGCGAENDVGSAHCVACGRRVNAPEAGNEELGDSVAAAAHRRGRLVDVRIGGWSDIDDWSQRDDTVRRCWAASSAERSARRRTASTRVGGCLVTGPLTW